MKIAVLGSNGLLGEAVARILSLTPGFEVRPVSRRSCPEFDLARGEELYTFIRSLGVDAVVNCAAWVDVAACEANPSLAFAINARPLSFLGPACRDLGLRLVQISTDYVFDGKSEIHRTDSPTRPLNVYGWTKLAAEMFTRDAGGDYLIVRPTILYTGKASSREFVARVLSQESFFDDSRIKYPVLVDEVAEGISDALLAGRSREILHFAGPEGLSKMEMAQQVCEVCEIGTSHLRARSEPETPVRPHCVRLGETDSVFKFSPFKVGLRRLKREGRL